MKKLSKILALVLAFTVFMSMSAFAATLTTGTNNKTITLGVKCASNAAGTTPITSADAGSTIYIFVTFEGNPDTIADTIQKFDLLMTYDPAKISMSAGVGMIASGAVVNTAFTDGVAYATWASIDGFYDAINDAIYTEGNLIRFKATTAVALSEADLTNILGFTTTATSAGKVQDAQIADGSNRTFTITIPDTEVAKVPTDETVAVLEADTTPIVSEDGKTQYNDVAVFVADFSLADYKDVEDYGVKFADKKESLKGVTGNGTLSWVFAFYGIGEGETPAVETFKTILK